MNILARCPPSRWVDFLTIPDDAMPTRSGADVDLFVGRNQSITIILDNDAEIRFRDVVVLGELIINSSNPENKAMKPKLIVRDFFPARKLSADNISIQCRNYYAPKGVEEFRRELRELFFESMQFQRETVNRIGLQSILV